MCIGKILVLPVTLKRDVLHTQLERLRWSSSYHAVWFEPDRSRRIFRAKKSAACLPSEGK
jgi:hypothetical protein